MLGRGLKRVDGVSPADQSAAWRQSERSSTARGHQQQTAIARIIDRAGVQWRMRDRSEPQEGAA
jgi:hypothetical protein